MTISETKLASAGDDLLAAMRTCRGGFIVVAIFSAFLNLLMLTAPLYMLQVFDRVLTSRSTDTLLALSLIAATALLALALLDGIRSFALIKIGNWLERRLSHPLLRASISSALRGAGGPSIQGLRDLATFRGFVGGPSVLPLMDAPWTPLFLAVIFLLSPLLGWMAVGGAIVLIALAMCNEFATRGLLQRAGAAQLDAYEHAQSAARNADAIDAMGMLGNLSVRWERHNADALRLQTQAGSRTSTITSTSKFVRLVLQVAMLGVGAWLVILNELTPGGMIASTILLGRALAPVDQAINSWKALLSARNAYHRLKAQLYETPADTEAMPLPKPSGAVRCEGITYTHPRSSEPALKNISIDLPPGKALGLIGPTASGKTTLARLLVGNLQPQFGHARLDGMDVSKWSSADRGQHLGYVPQDIELFGATIRENIARMGEGDAGAVVEAAKLAGVHELILRLPEGYDTRIGETGTALSGGQRQRIALARALYGQPSLVVLDEPNSNLDQAGLEALLNAIVELKKRATTLVIVGHQPSVMRQVDYLVVLAQGTVQMAGPRDEVIAKVSGHEIGNRPTLDAGDSIG